VEGRVSLFSRSRRMRQRLDKLRGHFIVCAYGRVGRSIARELEAGGVPFVVVDSKAELEPDLERDGRCYLIGDASDEAVLREAGIERAQGLICAVDSDAENVFITIVARSLSPVCSSWPGPPGSSQPTGCTERALPMWSPRM
jgi:voltage-gated potassium channel